MFELKCVTHRKNPDLGFDHQPSHTERKLQDQSDGHGNPGQAFYRRQGIRLRQRSAHDRTAWSIMRPYVAVSLKKRNDEDPWGVMQAVLDYGDRVGKMIVAVDEDINVKDPVAVTWAITHRSQPHKDVKIVRRPALRRDAHRHGRDPPVEPLRQFRILAAHRRHAQSRLSAAVAAEGRIHGARQRDLGRIGSATVTNRKNPGMAT